MENSPLKSATNRTLLVVTVILVVFAGCSFVSPEKEAPQPSSKTHEIVSVDEEWNEYRDYGNHFSFRFPKEVTNIHGCSDDEKKKVALTVLRDMGGSYVREAEVAVWSDDGTCVTKPLERELVQYKNFAFISADAKNDDEINAFLKREFGPGCRIYEKKADAAHPSKINIVVAQSDPDVPEDQLCFINYMTNVVWSEQWGKIVKWDIGQDFNFVDETKKDQNEFGHVFDGEISESFRFE